MLGSPAFAAERDDTRDLTLHAIERLAKKSGKSERAVAETLLGLMHHALGETADEEPKSVAGYWLLGAGQSTLQRALGLPESNARRRQLRIRRAALPTYLGENVGSALSAGDSTTGTSGCWPA